MAVLGAVLFDASLLAAPPALDASLNPKLANTSSGDKSVTVQSAVQQADGKIVIVGQFTSVNGVARRNIVRLNADGTVDAGFDPNPNRTSSALNGVLIQTDGKLVVHGEFANFQPNNVGAPVSRSFIARLHTDGTVDESLDLGVDGRVTSAALQSDGKLVIAGTFTRVKGTRRAGIARIAPDGTLDETFNPNPNESVDCVALQPDGKILLGGIFTTLRPNDALSATPRLQIARVNSMGDLDTAFDPAADGGVHSIAVQADGKILVGGLFGNFSPNGASTPTPRERFARLNADGTVDAGFRAGLFGIPASSIPVSAYSSAVQADGKFLVAGPFEEYRQDTTVGSSPLVAQRGLLRFDASGAIDADFNAGLNDSAFGISLQGDGSILPAGRFTKLTGSTRLGIGRLKNDPAAQSIAVTGTTKVEWLRSGGVPLVSWAVFEQSLDHGATWTALGVGSPVGTTANWELTGLSLPANCAIRVRGAAPGGKNNGSSSLVEQVALAPEVGTNPATQITPETALLSGMVSANGFATECSFQYSTDPTLLTGVTTVDARTIPAGGSNVVVSKPVTGLAANTTYYFRIVAENFAGMSEGGIASFATPNSPPTALDDAILLDKAATSQITIDALANDLDPNGDPLRITVITAPKQGTAILDGALPGNKILYTPGPGYATSGSDAFTYSITDSNGGTSNAKVTLTFSEFAMQAGQFAGQLSGAGGSIEGSLTLTLSKTGSFSAVVVVGSVRKTVKGTFDGNGDFASPDGLVNLHLDLTATSGGPGSFAITGTVAASVGAPQLALSGANAAYPKNTLPVESGSYTVLLEHPGLAPGGIGWAAMTVGKGGKVGVAGRLSDGTALSCSTTLVGGAGPENVAHLSAVLPYPVKGSLSGGVAFNDTQSDTDCAGVLRWIKPMQTKGALYLSGFDVAELDFAASRYTPPNRGVRALAFEEDTPNGTITLYDGNIPTPMTKDLNFSTTNVVSITSANTEAVTVKVNASKGTFTGSFLQLRPPATKAVRVPFGGVIYQKVPLATGFFLSPTASGGVEIMPAP